MLLHTMFVQYLKDFHKICMDSLCFRTSCQPYSQAVNDTTIIIIIIGMSFFLLENEHTTFLYSMCDIELCVEAMKLRRLKAIFPFAFLVEVCIHCH